MDAKLLISDLTVYSGRSKWYAITMLPMSPAGFGISSSRRAETVSTTGIICAEPARSGGVRARVMHAKMKAERASFVEIYEGDWLLFESPMVSGRDAETFDLRAFSLLLEKKNVSVSTSWALEVQKQWPEDVEKKTIFRVALSCHWSLLYAGLWVSENNLGNQTDDHPHRRAPAAFWSTSRLEEVQPRLPLCRIWPIFP